MSIFFLKQINFKNAIAISLLIILFAESAIAQNGNSNSISGFIGDLKTDMKKTGTDILDMIRIALWLASAGVAVKKGIDVWNNRASWLELGTMVLMLVGINLFMVWVAGNLK